MKLILSLTLTVLFLSSACSTGADEGKSDAPSAAVRKRTRTVIPVIRLSGTITEKPAPEDFPFSFGGETSQSLHGLLKRLEQAKGDDNVPAMVLQLGTVSIGRAQLEELVRSLEAVKSAGKKIHVHTELFSTQELVLISHASEVSMVPTGYMFITGLYGEQIFLRGMLDKIGVVPDYFTCGNYKSAGEMFMRHEPSDESAEMSKWLFDSIWDNMVSTIADGRGVEKKQAQNWVDAGVFTAERAIEAGIIDVVEHQEEFETRLRKLYGDKLKFDRRYGKKSSNQIDLSSPFGILNFYAELLAPAKARKSKKPGVGIVYLEGAIMPGRSGSNPFLADAAAFSDDIRKALDGAAEDDAIKAVVFRVNSPGGSAVASEVILNAAKRVAAKKPLIVSMGDVAASGGYYVACGTDTVFAEASTVTGSIGVVVGKFATTPMWDKLGIRFSPIQRGKNAAMLSSAAVFSESERTAIRSYMEETYEVFKGHVTHSRGDRLTKPIDDIAGGRVYSGKQALELGLVDKIGGLNEAVALAAERAELEPGYDVRIVPRPKNFMELLMSDMTGSKDDGEHLSLSRMQVPVILETALPLLQRLDPARVTTIKHALLQLVVLQQERVSLTMPLMTN
jgi:protease-4